MKKLSFRERLTSKLIRLRLHPVHRLTVDKPLSQRMYCLEQGENPLVSKRLVLHALGLHHTLLTPGLQQLLQVVFHLIMETLLREQLIHKSSLLQLLRSDLSAEDR